MRFFVCAQTNKDTNTRAHTQKHTHIQSKKMKPLAINFTAFVEIYGLERNHDHRRSVTKDTVCSGSALIHSLTNTDMHKHTNTRELKCLLYNSDCINMLVLDHL